ncbi:MAG: hypothetical protein ACREC6_00280 [Hyphomicrobiaceae bacterium]
MAAPDDNDKARQQARQRRMRSIAIALALVALAVLFYVATLVRLGGKVFDRPL